jgi:hypothetical protein
MCYSIGLQRKYVRRASLRPRSFVIAVYPDQALQKKFPSVLSVHVRLMRLRVFVRPFDRQQPLIYPTLKKDDTSECNK